ncbi:hypothetical protein BH23BAC4_BH23BAC4_06230 [soil metagenome]
MIVRYTALLALLAALLAGCSFTDTDPEPTDVMTYPLDDLTARLAMIESYDQDRGRRVVSLEILVWTGSCLGGQLYTDVRKVRDEIVVRLDRLEMEEWMLGAVCSFASPARSVLPLDLPLGTHRLHFLGPGRAGQYDVKVTAEHITMTPLIQRGRIQVPDPLVYRAQEGDGQIVC